MPEVTQKAGIDDNHDIHNARVDKREALKDLSALMMEENKDIREILSSDGSRCYYSALFMTEAYAGMLLKKEENPLELIADLVRENAAQYPKPISIDFFRSSPFEMSHEEILACLQHMLLKLSDFVNRTPEIEEIDMNPVFAYKDGAVVVDARIILSAA